MEVATARLKIEAQAERQVEQTAELERLRAALAEAQQGRIAAEQQAAVLSARSEAMTDRAMRAEQRVEGLEKQIQQAGQELSSARVQVQAQQTALDGAVRTSRRRSARWKRRGRRRRRPGRKRPSCAFGCGCYRPWQGVSAGRGVVRWGALDDAVCPMPGLPRRAPPRLT